jgi:hypothetical protein
MHAGVGAVATHLFVAGRCYWRGKQWAKMVRCWMLSGFCALLNPVWLCDTCARVFRSGGREAYLRLKS